jgi:two-component system CheB/CheR fusion protein
MVYPDESPAPPPADSTSSADPTKVILSAEELAELSAILHPRAGFDLSHYKPATITRRTLRRMRLAGCDTLHSYLSHLRHSDSEQHALIRDLLISVTDFFRDPEAFAVFEQDAARPRAMGAETGEVLRAWVPACATGEEAYTLAILLLEAVEAEPDKRLRLQVFATDVDNDALAVARRGIYPEAGSLGISPERRDRFFMRVEGGYQVKPFLRDVLSFATHNVCSDPPFSRMDFVSCRNLLIYLEGQARQHVVDAFHFALKPSGFLLLGSSETLSGPQFTLVSKAARLYQKTGLVGAAPLGRPDLAPSRRAPVAYAPVPSPSSASHRNAPTAAELAREAILRSGLPTLVLSGEGRILYSCGDIRSYVNLPQGEPRLDIFSVLRADLVSRLRPAIYRSRRDHSDVSVISSPDGDGPRTVMQVRPAPGLPDGTVIVTFQDVEAAPFSTTNSGANAEQEVLLQQLEEELRRTREDLRHTVEEREAVNEELRTSHEEAVSMNEELQSANEELEATTEELRSLNEELTTLNAQLKEKVDELEGAKNDLSNFFESTNLATLFLDKDMRIRRITPAAQELLQIEASDTGRVVHDIARDLLQQELAEDTRAVLHQLSSRSRELQAADGRWFVRRVLPYRTGSQHIGGVVVAFLDVTDLKSATQELAAREEQQGVVARLGLQALEEEDIGAFLDRVVREVQQTLGTDTCELLELQPGGQKMLLRAGVGWRDGLVRSALLDADMDSQAGFTLRSSAPLVIDELSSDRRFRPSPHHLEHGIVSGVYCAIQFGEVPYGILGAMSGARRRFTANETAFLHSVATLVASAVSRYQKRHRLALEHAVGWILANSNTIVEAAKRIHGAFARELGTSIGELWWPDAHGEQLTRIAFSNPDEPHREEQVRELFGGGTLGRGEGLIGRVWERGQPEWVSDANEEQAGELPRSAYAFGLTSVMALPVLSNNQVLGVLTVYSRRHLLADATLPRSLEAIGRAIGVFAGRLQAEASLREANRQKDEFLAMLGHELRNPLAAVRSAAELLRLMEAGDEQIERVRSVLQRQTSHMAKLLDGLLDVSRIVHGKIELERELVDLGELVREVAADYQPRFADAGTHLGLDLPTEALWVEGDRIRLTQVLDNLLSNAAKYCAAGKVELSLKPQGTDLVLRVRDDGLGISPDLLPYIFDTFRQARQNMDRSAGGLGLGLPLVRGLVGLHGGTVSAYSAGEQRGAEFVVRLPGTRRRPVPDSERRPHGGRSRILIVEDNEDAADLLKELLELRGHEVTVAPDGQRALDWLESSVPDVILCDLGLPGITGLDVARAIRSDSRFAHVWLVALTGYGRPEDKERCEKAGFDAHITKPVSLHAIEQMLNLRGTSRA